ncbi:hypothetical protein RJ641_019673 [Dillenia turbinata]|uniref:Uncharacterized protein n=1 Tax=Dillenia turbinata TaxID=194707 RepID=A0AAN8UWL2_9MAGN
MSNSRSGEHGLDTNGTSLLPASKELHIGLKQTALRDLHTETRMLTTKSLENSHSVNKRDPLIDVAKVSSIKRTLSETLYGPTSHEPPNSNPANGHLVYVRRKTESESGKGSICDKIQSSDDYVLSMKSSVEEKATEQESQLKEPIVASNEAISTIPTPSLTSSSSGEPTDPLSLGDTITKLQLAEANCISQSLVLPSVNNTKEKKHLEDHYVQLQTKLKQLDQSEQLDYVQMLRSLSSVELSRHAVELEKRTIRLLLDEGKELRRTKALNVLGKVVKKS